MYKKNQALLNWLISNLVVIFSNMQILYAFISTNLEKDLGLTIKQIALANSVYIWSFAILQFFSGAIFNLFSSRKIYFFSVLIIILGFLLLINSSNFSQLILSQVLVAIGASFGFVGASYISSMCFPIEQFGLMFSLVQTISSFSAMLIQISFSILLTLGAQWKNLIIYVILFGISVLVSIFFCITENHRVKGTIRIATDSILTVAKIKDIWVTAVVGSITFGTFLALNTLWAPRLLAKLGLNETQSGIATSLLWLGLGIGAPIIDQISQLFQNRRHTISAFATLQGLSIAMLFIFDHYLVVTFFMFIFGFAAGGHMLNFTVGGDLVNQEYVSISSSIINGFMFIGSGVIISFLALFSDYHVALSVISLMLMAASLLNYITKDSYFHKTMVNS